MDQIVPKHQRFEAADPDGVIVTLFRGGGLVRGWYIGPPSFNPDVPMDWHTSPEDNLLGSIALVRAMEIAKTLGLKLSVVDPDDLWAYLGGSQPLRRAETSASRRADQ